MDNVTTEFLFLSISFDLMKYPCKTQGVERIVKLTTESRSRVCVEGNGDIFIKTTMLSRSAMPSVNFKK